MRSWTPSIRGSITASDASFHSVQAKTAYKGQIWTALITIGMLIDGRIEKNDAIFYIVAPVIGAVLAAFLWKYLKNGVKE